MNSTYIEDVFTGSLSHLKDHMCDSAFYKELRAFVDSNSPDEEEDLYVLSKKNITNHRPIDEFMDNVKLHMKWHGAPGMSSEEKDNALQTMLVDRLMDGIALIPSDGSEPKLLIDVPQSILKELYDTRQVMVRKYIFDCEE